MPPPPIKIAIIGSGPSAFYAAARLLAAGGVKAGASSSSTTRQGDIVSHVHMYERLPTPHGLVRFGVAPDHPEVKHVENRFAQVAQDPRFRFFGNVNVVSGQGSDQKSIASSSASSSASNTLASQVTPSSSYTYPHALRLPLADLAPHYTHLLFAYGCSQSRLLGIPGSSPGELQNVYAALDFVNWYNGHPAAHDEEFLAAHPWRRVSFDGSALRHATIIGAGNVALDVARIILRSSSVLQPMFHGSSSHAARTKLRETDIPEPVLAELDKCRVGQVDVVARRGPVQVAFTSKELREMMDLEGVAFRQPSEEHYALTRQQVQALEARSKSAEGASQELASETRVRKRLMSIMDKGSKADPASEVSWGLEFFKSPAILQSKAANSAGQRPAVSSVTWNEMEFERVPSVHDRDQPWSGGTSPLTARVRSTGKQTTTETDMVIASVGYRGEPLSEAASASGETSKPSTSDLTQIPWDAQRGMVRNRGGQVVDEQGNVMPGLYTSGWVARGPVGVIASTRIDANSVAEQLMYDWQQSGGTAHLQGAHEGKPLDGAPPALTSTSQRIVSWQDWLALDARELERGKQQGKLREKFLSVKEMLNYLG